MKYSPALALWDFARRAFRAAAEDDLSGTAAQMTYYFMLALFPSLILIVALIDVLPISADASIYAQTLSEPLPPAVADLLSRWLENFARTRPPGSVLLWIIVAWWAASRGVRGARKGLNRVFRTRPQHNYFTTRLRDLLFTAAALLLVGVAYLLLVGGAQLGAFLSQLFNLSSTFQTVWDALRWPAILLFLGGFLVAAYRYLPGKRLPLRRQVAGAFPALIGWIILGIGFRTWLSHIGRFNELYGSLASFFILMFLLWLVSLVLLVGGEIAARE